MTDVGNPRTVRILLHDLLHLPTAGLSMSIIACPTVDELLIHGSKDPSKWVTIVACRSDRLYEVIDILAQIEFDALYILNVGHCLSPSPDPWWTRSTVVHNDQQLMRDLCLKSMLCSFAEALQHRKNSDAGLANRCLLDALHALEDTKRFA